MTTRPSRLRPCLFLLGFLLAVLPATQFADAQDAQPYVLPNCIITGEKLDVGAFSFTYDGRQIKTCCELCMEDFYKDPVTYIEKIEEAEKKIKK